MIFITPKNLLMADVGDLVKIKSKQEIENIQSYLAFFPNMYKQCQKIARVISVSEKSYLLEINNNKIGFYWDKRWVNEMNYLSV